MTNLFTSKRLQFRNWNEGDLEQFAAMNSNPEVMRYYTEPYALDRSKALLDRLKQMYIDKKYTLFCVELKDSNTFIGMIGIMDATFQTEPAIEIGWRLLPQYWNKGYATEGAKRSLQYGFNKMKIKDIYAVTSTVNKASERVMQKIGMTKTGEFLHPKIDEVHALALHVKYLISS